MKIFKVKNLNRKKIITAFLVGLFIMSALTVIDSSFVSSNSGSHALASTSTDSFTFPYQYGTPTIPSDVGAQGIQGPTIPLSQIGSTVTEYSVGSNNTHGHIGPMIHQYPSNLLGIVGDFTVDVRNGTVSSSTSANDVLVSLQNATMGNYINATAISGVASFTNIPFGEYQIWIYGSSSYIDFHQLLFVNGTTITRYLVPVSYGNIAVNNGPVTDDNQTYYVSARSDYQSNTNTSGFPVSMYNSSTNDVIATAIALNNGTAIFSDVNYLYSYYFETVPFNPYEGMSMGGQDVGYWASVSHPTTTVYQYNAGILGGNFSYSGTVQYGIGPASGSSSWTLSSNTTLNGGVLYTGYSFSPSSYHVTVENATVIVIGGNSYMNVIWKNDTILLYDSSPIFGSVFGGLGNSSFYNDEIYGPGLSTPGSAYGFDAYNIENTILEYTETPDIYWQIPFAIEHLAYNVLIQNISANTYYFAGIEKANYLTMNNVSFSYGYDQSIGNFTLDNSKFTNSILNMVTNEPLQKIIMNNDWISSYFITGADQSYVNNTYLSYEWYSYSSAVIRSPYPEQGFADGYFLDGGVNTTGHFNHVTLTEHDVYSNFTTYYNDWYNAVKNSNLQYGLQFKELTPTFSYYNDSAILFNNYPNVNQTLTNAKVNSIFYFNNGILNLSYPISPMESYWINNSKEWTSVDAFGIQSIPGPSHDTILNSWINDTAGIIEGGANLTIEHNIFTFQYDAYPWDPMQTVNSNVITRSDISNNTYEYVYLNLTVAIDVNLRLYGGVLGYNDIQNQVPSFGPANQYMNITHNTFLYPQVGITTQLAGSFLMDGGENDYIMNMSDNVFMNEISHVLGPGKYDIIPFSYDILDVAGNGLPAYIDNNWFLNLNTHIIPIGGNTNETGSQGWKPVMKLSNNHFFYMPFYGQSYVNPSGATNNTEFLKGSTNITFTENSGGQTFEINNHSTIAYEIPIYLNDSLTASTEQVQYIYNSSILQRSYSGTGIGGNNAVTNAYSWVIVPDVNTLSGTPVISYNNGYVGGLQPDFTWKGYDYTESVEPTYIQVGVNSSKAPSIGIAFNGVAGELYHVQVINGNDVIQNISVVANSNGVVQVTYNPSTMPLDPIFNLIPPPSPSSPVHVILKKALSYTKLIAISASLLVIVAVAYFYTKSSGGKSGSGGGERRI